MDTKVAQSTRCHFNQSMYAYERGRGGGGEEEFCSLTERTSLINLHNVAI